MNVDQKRVALGLLANRFTKDTMFYPPGYQMWVGGRTLEADTYGKLRDNNPGAYIGPNDSIEKCVDVGLSEVPDVWVEFFYEHMRYVL